MPNYTLLVKKSTEKLTSPIPENRVKEFCPKIQQTSDSIMVFQNIRFYEKQARCWISANPIKLHPLLADK